MIIYLLMVLFIILIGNIRIRCRISLFARKRTNNNIDADTHPYRTDRMKYFLWFIVLTLVSGLRGPSVGTDTAGYLNIFLAQNGLSYGNTNQEFLFQVLCKLIGRFTDNPQWLLVISAGIMAICTLYFIKRNTRKDTLAVFYYIALYFYFFAMNGLRQFIAISFVLVAAQFAKERKIIPFIIFIAIAIEFHITAVFGVSLWWIYSGKITVKKMVIIGVLMISFYAGFSYIQRWVAVYLSDYYSYISGTREYEAGKMMPIVYSFIFLAAALVAFFDEGWRTPEHMALLCISEVAMIWGLSPFFIRILNTNYSQRLGWLFQVFSIVLIPNMLESKLFKKNHGVFVFIFYIVGLAHLFYFLGKGWHQVTPYTFFFNSF